MIPHSDKERDGTNGGDDSQNNKGDHGSEEALSKTVKELVKATVEKEMAKLKAGSTTEHPGASGSPRNAV